MFGIVKKIVPPSAKRKIKLMQHSGDRFTCPLCGYKCKDFAPFGLEFPVIEERQIVGAGLRDALCYSCGSTDRERLVFLYLKNKTNLFEEPEKKRILHMAPEKNLTSIMLKSGFERYVCGDLFMEGYSYPDHVQNMNVLNIPYEDDFFDLVICNHLLEHVPDDRAAMKELHRVLKSNGMGILQVPISLNSPQTFEDFSVTDPQQREIVFGQFDHLRIYGQDYPDRLSEAGFVVERSNYASEYSRYGVNDDEDIFVVRKH